MSESSAAATKAGKSKFEKQLVIADAIQDAGFPEDAEAHRGWFVIGNQYLIRTVTMYWVGRVIGLNRHGIILGDAIWIQDTGRWHNSINQGLDQEEHSELEPVPADENGKREAFVSWGGIIDALPYNHKLPVNGKGA